MNGIPSVGGVFVINFIIPNTSPPFPSVTWPFGTQRNDAYSLKNSVFFACLLATAAFAGYNEMPPEQKVNRGKAIRP